MTNVPGQDPSLMLREFHHRVANTLAVFSASLRRDFSSFDDPRLRATLARHEQQLANFGALFHFLAVGARQDAISSETYFRPFIEILAKSILAPIGARCEVFIADDLISAAMCERMALIITELVMNAAKHAFHNRPGGSVNISIRKVMAAWHCAVSDDGIGAMHRQKGLGSTILDELASSMGGRVTIRSGLEGTQVLVSFPVTPEQQWFAPSQTTRDRAANSSCHMSRP